VWGYNDRNELDDSDRYNTFDPNSPGSPSDPNHAFDRAYGYDPIGNRDEYKEGTDPNTAYTTNSRNQYTATTNPSESFSYDDDGNLTDDGTWDYTWDAENRLITVEPDATPKNGDKKVEFVYDFLGRRVEKTVSTHNGTSWSVTDRRRFVWSDWLPVLELDATDPNDVAILRKYTWGLDLAGQSGPGNSVDSAGGIGGLLATEDIGDSKDYYYLYDANGNVGQVLDASDGSVDGHYEYDAYGNTVISSGDFAADNPFRFSTKYCDDELDYAGTDNDGLCYFGYRYYSPRLGRWLNRDPIHEPGHELVKSVGDGDASGRGLTAALEYNVGAQVPWPAPGSSPGAAPITPPLESDGLNLYRYVQNGPTVFVDPLGEASKWPVCCGWIGVRCYQETGNRGACAACAAHCLIAGRNQNPCHMCDGVCGLSNKKKRFCACVHIRLCLPNNKFCDCGGGWKCRWTASRPWLNGGTPCCRFQAPLDADWCKGID